MADDRMAALELLRKAAGDGDLDFLREEQAMLTRPKDGNDCDDRWYAVPGRA